MSAAPGPAISHPPPIVATLWFFAWAGPLVAGVFAHVTRTWAENPWLILRYAGVAAVGLGMTYLSIVFGFNLAGGRDGSLGLWLPLAVGAIAAVLTTRWAARRGVT